MRAHLSKLSDALKGAVKYSAAAGDADPVKSLYNYNAKRALYYRDTVEKLARELLAQDILAQDIPHRPALERALRLKPPQRYEEMEQIVAGLQRHFSSVTYSSLSPVHPVHITLPSLPPEIRDEIHADITELGKCFDAQCYRSAIVLCGRILETALHRKYFDVIGKDILETQPGIGLGTLVAKLKEKNVRFDPAITQQIHLINQVRISSVHKKSEPFIPRRAQAHATILYTLDVVERMFKR